MFDLQLLVALAGLFVLLAILYCNFVKPVPKQESPDLSEEQLMTALKKDISAIDGISVIEGGKKENYVIIDDVSRQFRDNMNHSTQSSDSSNLGGELKTFVAPTFLLQRRPATQFLLGNQ